MKNILKNLTPISCQELITTHIKVGKTSRICVENCRINHSKYKTISMSERKLDVYREKLILNLQIRKNYSTVILIRKLLNHVHI